MSPTHLTPFEKDQYLSNVWKENIFGRLPLEKFHLNRYADHLPQPERYYFAQADLAPFAARRPKPLST